MATFSTSCFTSPLSISKSQSQQRCAFPSNPYLCPRITRYVSCPTSRPLRFNHQLRASLDDEKSVDVTTSPPSSTAPLTSSSTDTSESTSTSTSTSPSSSSSSSSYNWLEEWYPVAWKHDLKPRAPFAFRIFDKPYVLVHDEVNGEYKVFDDACPHRTVPLSEGRVFIRKDKETGKRQTVIECRYHGWRFDCNDGTCIDIPNRTEPPSTKAANIRDVYPTTVAPFGLVFVWLSTSKPPTPLPIPEKLYDEDLNITYFRRTQRGFPFPIEVLMENLVDPAHVPWAHHRVEGDRRQVPRETGLGVQLLESDASVGKIMGQVHGNIMGKLDMGVGPNRVIFRGVNDKQTGDPRLEFMIWAVPVDRNTSWLFAIRGFINPPFLLKLTLTSKPDWADHGLSNAVLDGDSPFLQWQHVELLQTQHRNGGKTPGWRSRYLFSQSNWDTIVAKYRIWFDTVSEKMPYASPLSTLSLTRLTVQQVNDRVRYHTLYCAACTKALARARFCINTTTVIGPLAAFAALATLLVAIALRLHSPVAARALMKYASGCASLSVFACMAWFFAKQVERSTTYSDKAHKLAMLDDTHF